MQGHYLLTYLLILCQPDLVRFVPTYSVPYALCGPTLRLNDRYSEPQLNDEREPTVSQLSRCDVHTIVRRSIQQCRSVRRRPQWTRHWKNSSGVMETVERLRRRQLHVGPKKTTRLATGNASLSVISSTVDRFSKSLYRETYQCFSLRPDRCKKYCYQRVCLSVCLSARISQQESLLLYRDRVTR